MMSETDTFHNESRNSSVGIETGYGLEGGPSIPWRGKIFLYYSIHTGSGAHQASYPMGTVGVFLGGKAAGAWCLLLTFI
jgi:hypothetical protein